MSRVFWDSNLYIYLFEEYGQLTQRVAQMRQSMLARGDQLVTSSLTLGEVLVKPLEEGDEALSAKYSSAIQATSLLQPFDVDEARIYARIRRDRSIKSPDAIQLACAASAGVDLFITNDARLSGKIIDGIQFIVSLDRAPI